jgi:hypothetical protein
VADWVIRRLSAEDERPSFDCGEEDLNEFFAVDSIRSGRELLSVTYVVVDKNDVVAFFSLSNDSIRKDSLEKSIWKKLTAFIPFQKRYSTLPAVKIGRLATHANTTMKKLSSSIREMAFHFYFQVMSIKRPV